MTSLTKGTSVTDIIENSQATTEEPTHEDRVEELREVHRQAAEGPSEKATDAQRSKGKLLARERIDLLLDPGSFTEIDTLRRHRATGFGLEDKRPAGDGVITGWGTVEGQQVFVYAHDFRVFGGALGEAHAQKICKVIELAAQVGCPVVALNDGAGARVQEGIVALAGYGSIFQAICAASGVIPQISVMLGPCAGGAAYAPALTDFVFMVRQTSNMFITGPDVVKAVTGEEVSFEELGGAAMHTEDSGAAHVAFDDEETCLQEVRYLLSILPPNNETPAPRFDGEDSADRMCPDLESVVPTSGNIPYDMRDVVSEVVDDGEYFEVHATWGQSLLCLFAHLDGALVGIVASQPSHLAGALDIPSSEKGARFVQFCDAFSIPLVTLVDVPGFLPGVGQERGGIIRHGAQLLYAFCTATVPRVTLVVRKAYGGAYIVMNSQTTGADVTLAWPTNEIAVMGAEGATGLVFRKELAEADDVDAAREELQQQYRDEVMHPYYAAERGLVEQLIEPAESRRQLIGALRMLRDKSRPLPHRKHGNPPQ